MSEETKQEIIFWVTAIIAFFTITGALSLIYAEYSGLTDQFISSFAN